MSDKDKEQAVISVVSAYLGIPASQITVSTKLSPNAHEICTRLTAKLAKTIVCGNIDKMTVGEIFKQLDL